jgi:hypothetical protein
MKTFLQQATPVERESLARAVNSSVGYFYLIAGGHRRPSTDLCRALTQNEPKLSLHRLRPDVWEEGPSDGNSEVNPSADKVSA